MLAGVLVPTAGRVSINGIDLVGNPMKWHMGYIPDRPYLYDKLTAREFLQFVGGMYGLSQDEMAKKEEELLTENHSFGSCG